PPTSTLFPYTTLFRSWTVGRSHRLHKRPIRMPLAILAALMRPQKHSCPILSWRDLGFKRVGLHYIGFRERQCCNQNTCQPHSRKNSRIFGRRDEPGLGGCAPSRGGAGRPAFPWLSRA